jgi:hypothetical protein
MHGLNVKRLEGNCKNSKSVRTSSAVARGELRRNTKKAKPPSLKLRRAEAEREGLVLLIP